MSLSTKFYTLEPMFEAVVESVSSQTTAHPAEHALTLEPNFAWQAGSEDQHEIVIDLGKPFNVDSLVWIHREEETLTPSPIGVYADVYFSNDNVIFTQASLDVDPGVNGELLKISEFTVPTAQRWWKIVFRGSDDPSYYAPENLRVSALWLANKHEISAAPLFSRNDVISFPSRRQRTAFDNYVGVGLNSQELVEFKRVYPIDDTDQAVVEDVLRNCCGGRALIAYQEREDDPMLVRLSDKIAENKFALGWRYTTLGFTKEIIVAREDYY